MSSSSSGGASGSGGHDAAAAAAVVDRLSELPSLIGVRPFDPTDYGIDESQPPRNKKSKKDVENEIRIRESKAMRFEDYLSFRNEIRIKEEEQAKQEAAEAALRNAYGPVLDHDAWLEALLM
jgi:hypothetical protein